MTSIEISSEVVTIVVTIVTALVTVMGFVISRKTEKIKIMESQLSEKKYKAYADAVDMFYSVLKDAKSKNGIINEERAREQVLSAKRDIFMYGSDNVFKAFNCWLVSSSNGDDGMHTMQLLIDFMLEIRRELCGGNTKLTDLDLMINLTQNEIEAKKLHSHESR